MPSTLTTGTDALLDALPPELFAPEGEATEITLPPIDPGDDHFAALAGDLACALDPVKLARRAGLPPDPWQADYLRSARLRHLLNCSRQSGKSTIVGVKAIHRALYYPGSLVLMLSPSLRQSGELFRKAIGVYQGLGRPIPADSETALTVTLENKSRIVSLPGKPDTIRGYSAVAALFIDEAAMVADPLYMAVRPMLAVSGGSLDALSTPKGTRGWWYEAWRAGGEIWRRFEVNAGMCPRIPPEFLAEEEETMGEWWFLQEYWCKFMDAETQPFSREDIDRAFEEKVEAWDL